MKVVKIREDVNSDALEVLELTAEKVKSGEVKAISISWVTSDNGIGGTVSAGDNQILMWASAQHSATSLYEQMIED